MDTKLRKFSKRQFLDSILKIRLATKTLVFCLYRIILGKRPRSKWLNMVFGLSLVKLRHCEKATKIEKTTLVLCHSLKVS